MRTKLFLYIGSFIPMFCKQHSSQTLLQYQGLRYRGRGREGRGKGRLPPPPFPIIPTSIISLAFLWMMTCVIPFVKHAQNMVLDKHIFKILSFAQPWLATICFNLFCPLNKVDQETALNTDIILFILSCFVLL